MGLQSGTTNNPHGRPKGARNKATKDLRIWISRFIEDNQGTIQDDWDKLKPKERVLMFERLLKYVLPVLQSTSIDADFEKLTDEQLDNIIEKLKNQQ